MASSTSYSHRFTRTVLGIFYLLLTSFGSDASAAESSRISIPKGSSASARQSALPQTNFLSPQNFQANVSGQALTNKDQIFRTLLAGDGQNLTWPAFPRTWHEQSVSTMITSNTALGFSLAGITGAASIEFKWSLKTSVIVIATNRKHEANVDTNQVTTEPVSDPLQFELFRWDEATRRALPKVSPDYPMVALCAFETSLNYGETARGGVTFLGSGQTIEGTVIRSVSHTMFSKFFQLDGKRSLNQILNDVCSGAFRESVEKHAHLDFSRTVTELFAYHHTSNQCAPSYEDSRSNAGEGDATCLEWHRKKYPKTLRSLTVPRCEIGRSGHYRCVAKSKFYGSCPMNWDSQTQSSSAPDRMRPKKWPIKATGSPLEFDCDTASGLSCQMSKAPVTLLGVPIWRGKARCVSNLQSI